MVDELSDMPMMLDIAIVELEEELDLSTYRPICLPSSQDDKTFVGETLPVFSFTEPELVENNKTSIHLQRKYHTILEVEDDELSYLFFKSNGESKKGDSGGPLTYSRDGQHVLIGELFGGSVENQTFAFTKIYPHLDWIMDVLEYKDDAVFAPHGPYAMTEMDPETLILIQYILGLFVLVLQSNYFEEKLKIFVATAISCLRKVLKRSWKRRDCNNNDLILPLYVSKHD